MQMPLKKVTVDVTTMNIYVPNLCLQKINHFSL